MSRVNSTSGNSRQHPTDEILNKLAKHKLASGEVANVQLHVSKCRRCQTILDEFRVEESEFREGHDRTTEPFVLGTYLRIPSSLIAFSRPILNLQARNTSEFRNVARHQDEAMPKANGRNLKIVRSNDLPT